MRHFQPQLRRGRAAAESRSWARSTRVAVWLTGLLVCGAPVVWAPAAHAWDAATTHAGMTEQAALASTLSKALADQFDQPLGLYELLPLELGGARGERIKQVLAQLPADDGYAPVGGRLSALGWVTAGSVIEEMPVERVRHHFYDPTTRSGLAEGGLWRGVDLRLSAFAAGAGALRDALTGGGFDGTGQPSVAWLTAPENDLGLPHFLDARERAVAAETPRQRAAALAEALLLSGALLHVIEDAAEPALVRGDYRGEFAEAGGPLRTWVAARYGRLGIPAPEREPVAVDHLAELITNDDGSGLADRTAARFFSSGTLPDHGASRPPAVQATSAASGYVAGEGIAHLLAWRRTGERVQWFLDQRCLTDYAQVLLADAVQAARSALEHLWRGRLVLAADTVRVGPVPLGRGRVAFYVDDAGGKRRLVTTREVTGAAAEESLVDIPALPEGRRLVVVFRGVDENDDPIVVSAERGLSGDGG